MARALWKGTLGFGPVAAPVKLYAASSKKGVDLSSAPPNCGGAVGTKRYCKKCEQTVTESWQQMDKRFDYGEEQSVILTSAELAAIPLNSSRRIEMIGFLHRGAAPNHLAVDKNYYIAAADGGEHAFALICAAMEAEGLLGIASICLHTRESRAVVEPLPDGRVVLSTLHWSDEVNDDPVFYREEEANAFTPRELNLTARLLNTMTMSEVSTVFMEDTYDPALRKMIEDKLRNGNVQAPVEKSPTVAENMEAMLEAALAEVDG